MWYDIQTMLSKNKLLNFIISNRGDGKTYGFKDWAIRDFLKKGNQFIYLRRYKSELKKCHLFFADIKDKYPNHDFKFEGGEFKIDGKTAGYAIPLSTALTQKSVSYPHVNKIGYDEFIIDKQHIRYLPNEVISFLEFYETVARTRDNVRVIFMGNSITIVNPYFIYFNFMPKAQQRFTIRGDILIDLYKDEEFIREKYKTRFGKLIRGTAYGNYAIENEFKNDNEDFITKRSADAKFMFIIYYKGMNIGVWFDFNNRTGYCSKKYDKNCHQIFSFTNSDFKPNHNLIKNYKDHWSTKTMIELFKESLLYFDDIAIKTLMYELFSSLNIF